jgi:tetratricopeptide (TPR) repeat protein
MLLREAGDDTEIERCFSQVLDDLARRGGKTSVRADLHLRLGQHYEHRLMLPGRAIAQYRAALELDATLIAAITAARGIYLNSGKGEPAADMFELQVAATADLGQRHALLVQLAKHRRELLSDLDGAVLVLRRALKAMPNDPTTLEHLADLLRERAGQVESPNADADRGRAAELYFQVARSVPRGQARPHLHACLALSPEHKRAHRMLAELNAYGAGGEQPVQAGVPQAELDSRSTGKHTPLPSDGSVHDRPTSPPPGMLTRDEGADEDVAAWLDDAEIEMIDDAVTTDSVVPLSERPPAPFGPQPKARIPTLRKFKV